MVGLGVKLHALDVQDLWHTPALFLSYRLAPQHHFPAQFEDGITAVKYFLQDKILRKYGVDPTRVAISGDSSGGTLAAAVTQQVGISGSTAAGNGCSSLFLC